MEIKEAIRTAIKELIVPEMVKLKQENLEIKTILTLTNKRLDDINGHLIDQSRRIDALREELTKQIGSVREELTDHIRSVREELTKHIGSVREELINRIEETNRRLEAMGNKFDDLLNRLYEVIVRRDEHTQVIERVMLLERDVAELKRQMAA